MLRSRPGTSAGSTPSVDVTLPPQRAPAMSPVKTKQLPPVSPPPAMSSSRRLKYGVRAGNVGSGVGGVVGVGGGSASGSSVPAYDAVIKGMATGALEDSVRPTVYTRDISGLLDRPSRAWERSTEATPETLIPEQYHVFETSEALPRGEARASAAEPNGWVKEGYRRYVRRMFPKMQPTGRQQAIVRLLLLLLLLLFLVDCTTPFSRPLPPCRSLTPTLFAADVGGVPAPHGCRRTRS